MALRCVASRDVGRRAPGVLNRRSGASIAPLPAIGVVRQTWWEFSREALEGMWRGTHRVSPKEQ